MSDALLRNWCGTAAVSLIGLLLGYAWMARTTGTAGALRWLAVAAATSAFLLVFLRRNLKDNRKAGSTETFRSLGTANTLTIGRGGLAAGLAGFVGMPRPLGVLSWVPAALFLAIAVGDFLDGYIARVSSRVTVLGEKLDQEVDTLSLALAVALAIRYGRVPEWYLLLGLSAYLFRAHRAIRRARGRRIHPLTPSTYRRFSAGALYGFVGIALIPIVPAKATMTAAWMFALPVVLGFFRDWLVMTGRLKPSSKGYRRSRSCVRTVALGSLPPTIRLLAGAAALIFLFGGRGEAAPWMKGFADASLDRPPLWAIGMTLGTLLATTLVVTGVAGRTGALCLVGIVCIDTALRGTTTGTSSSLLILSIAVFLTGTGKHSVWRPEDDWLIQYAGTAGNRDPSGLRR